jgi:hemerythrin
VSLFGWKKEFCVGVPEIDAQRRRLFGMAEELYSALVSGTEEEILSRTFFNLVAFTKAHFATEERHMRVHGSPDYVVHKAQHQELTRKLIMLYLEFEAGNYEVSSQVLGFLHECMEHHAPGISRPVARPRRVRSPD